MSDVVQEERMNEETVVPHWALVLRALLLLAVGASLFEAHYDIPDQLGLVLLLVLTDSVAGLARLPALNHLRLVVRAPLAVVWLLSIVGVVGALVLLDQERITLTALGVPVISWTLLLGAAAVTIGLLERHPTYRWSVLEWALLWFAVSGVLVHGHLWELPTGAMLAWTTFILGAGSVSLLLWRSWRKAHGSREDT